jgi:hypothetical protein
MIGQKYYLLICARADTVVARFGADKEKLLAHLMCVVKEVPYENWGFRGTPLTPESVNEDVGISE